jgi:hypothetical protein
MISEDFEFREDFRKSSMLVFTEKCNIFKHISKSLCATSLNKTQKIINLRWPKTG